MSDANNNDSNNVSTAQCGACKAMIPSDSESCPECQVSFSGVQNVDMGECGSCNAIIPIDSKSCPECKIPFVLDDLINNMSNWMKKEKLSVTDVFGKWDENDDGVLSSTEIRNGLIDAKLAVLPDSEVDRFMHQIDLNNDNDISLGELSALLLLPPESDESDSDEKSEIRYSDNVLDRVMKKHDIDDTEAFLKYTNEHYDDGNSYLNEKELTKAAVAWNDSIKANETEDTEIENEVQESDQENDQTDDEDTTSLDEDDSQEEDTSESEVEGDDEDSEEGDEDEASEEEDEDDASEEEDEDEASDKSTDSASDAFKRLHDAVIESGETAITVFEKLDRNESNNVDPEEFKNAVNEAFGDEFTDDDLTIIITALDSDKDGFIDIIELTGAI